MRMGETDRERERDEKYNVNETVYTQAIHVPSSKSDIIKDHSLLSYIPCLSCSEIEKYCISQFSSFELLSKL